MIEYALCVKWMDTPLIEWLDRCYVLNDWVEVVFLHEWVKKGVLKIGPY